MNIHAAIKASKLTQLSIQPSHKDNRDSQKSDLSADAPRDQHSQTILDTTVEKSKMPKQENIADAKVQVKVDTKVQTKPDAKTSITQPQNQSQHESPPISRQKNPHNNKTPLVTNKAADNKPMFKSVDVSIAGTPHRITCPSNEVDNLEVACQWINDKIREIRNVFKSKSPSNEELLVLTCLELYDQVQTLKLNNNQYKHGEAEAKELIDKMIADIRTSL